ncbi:hypothetical protein D7B24_003272 [Verticillium nonalfalfae]|uniref:Tat pathway signal sequence n=1 Tax=Verticillium nonalfalfae TaxID=1051616 RepID=A0A3M9YFF0_9PEZI|nr:uncharacterized protein D7B24_003272 [Verticillium nonalfalfae]RNJ59179.1 hypothetical protein D7B24_003272 [Verticillium nonalfalfae]
MFSKEEIPSKPLADRVDESEEDAESLQSLPSERSWTKRITKYMTALAVLIFTSLVSMRVGAHLATRPSRLDASCAAHTTQWSPVLRDIDVTYSTKHFNGSFLKENIYRQKGSPEVDAAWEALGVDYRAGVISIEDGLASGLDMSFVQRNPKYGAGFFVNVEGMHHLHCLNLVRKSLFFNYDYYKALGEHAFENNDKILSHHVTHCLDMIRQVLMCNVDTGVLGQVWANQDEPAAFPDFNTRHQCKNYEDVQEWANKLQAPPAETVPEDYLEPPRHGDVIPGTP